MWFAALFLSPFSHSVLAKRHDSDLMSFVTLPEVRALKWDIHYYDRARTKRGYWFVAPYGQIDPEPTTKKYQQYQIGPYIYDDTGMLIWAGSPMWENKNIFDFRPVHTVDTETHLSMIVDGGVDDGSKGKGVIINKHFQVEHEVNDLSDLRHFNMHEFNVLPGGGSALACAYRPHLVTLAELERPAEESWVLSGGFVELDVWTSEILFEWDSIDHVALHESHGFHKWTTKDKFPGWDYAHINSVDKNDAGDYIISLRFTDTIYGISGKDGHILWRLGGNMSDFDQDFSFSRQHNAKFVDSNSTHHVILVLNNASDEESHSEDVSALLLISVETSTMTARIMKRINRPDDALTRLRGSVSVLNNGNFFIGWSEFGYQSEHAPDGDVLMTARFVSERFSTYRAYKADFVGLPTRPPDVVATVYGTGNENILTIVHVSWNGATDVARWTFSARAPNSNRSVRIGQVNKTDFETMYLAAGYMDWITVEAYHADGRAMGKSHVTRSNAPENWEILGFRGDSSPSPDDPAAILLVEKELASSQYATDAACKDESSTTESSNDNHFAIVAIEDLDTSYWLPRGFESWLILVLLFCITASTVWILRYVFRRRFSKLWFKRPGLGIGFRPSPIESVT